MRRSLSLTVCLLPLWFMLVGPATPGVRAEEVHTRWEREILALAPWAPDTVYEARTGAVEFTSLEGRRLAATLAFPVQAGAGAVLHLGEATPPATGELLAHLYLPLDLQRPTRALLDAYQGLSVLLSAPGVPAGQVAVVGQGEGAALAVALAALRPGEVGCVVAVDPRWPREEPGRASLRELAPLVRCPALVMLTRAERGEAVALPLAQSLGGPVDTATAPLRPELVWSRWVLSVLAHQAALPPVAVGDWLDELPSD